MNEGILKLKNNVSGEKSVASADNVAAICELIV
jgi:hypothetical protein